LTSGFSVYFEKRASALYSSHKSRKGAFAMYYTNENYAAFSKARKPMDVAERKAYIVGSGLAGLSAAVFLIRDGQMPGENITIFEELPLPGGGCDGIKDERLGYIIRGGPRNGKSF
jgi:myosin-crossreactive antigen